MNKSETSKLISAISGLYPESHYQKRDKTELKMQVELFHGMLKDIPFNIAFLSVQKHNAQSPFPPKICDIRKQVYKIMNPHIKTSGEAWGEALKSIQSYSPYANYDYLSNLSPLTRRTIEILGLQELAFSENMVADRAHFMKIYEVLQFRSQEQGVLSPFIRSSIAKISEAKQLTEGDQQ